MSPLHVFVQKPKGERFVPVVQTCQVDELLEIVWLRLEVFVGSLRLFGSFHITLKASQSVRESEVLGNPASRNLVRTSSLVRSYQLA